MLKPIAVLLVCQLAGETAARGLGLPIPGPVVGFLLLFVLLGLAERIRERRPAPAAEPSLSFLDPAPEAPLGRVADRLLGVLGLLFVPAGVGVVDHLGLFAAHGTALAAALVLSTLATLLATVFVFLAVARLLGGSGPTR